MTSAFPPFPRPRLPLRLPAVPTLTDPRPRLRAALANWRAEVQAARWAEAGVRTLLDSVSPDWVEVHPGAYVVGNDTTGQSYWSATLVVRDWPATVEAGWLAPALFGAGDEGDVSVALHTTRLTKTAAKRLLKTQRVVQTSVVNARAERGAISSPDEQLDLTSAEMLAPLVAEGAEALFSTALVLTLRAPSAETLAALVEAVHDALGTVELGGMRWQQRDGYLSAGVPYAADRLGRRKTLDTTTLALSFPFLSGDVGTPAGPFWGISLADRSPVHIDLWDTAAGWPAPHVVVVAPTGSGKTITLSHLVAEHLTQADPPDVIIVDPVKGDYRRFVREVGGQIVRLGAGGTGTGGAGAGSGPSTINAFDLPPAVIQSGTGEEAPQNPVLTQVRLATGLVALMVAEKDQPLRRAERAVVEDAILRAYAAKGITPDDEQSWTASATDVPVLPDVLAELARLGAGTGTDAHTASSAARDVAERLRPFCIGTLSGLFSAPTSLRIDAGVTSLDLEGMDEELRPLAVWLIGNYTWKLAKRDRRRRILCLEEVKTLLSFPESARLVAELYSLGRAYGLSVWSASQLLSDYAATPDGQRAIDNAHTVVLLNGAQEAPARFALSAADHLHLRSCAVGQGHLLTPRGHCRFEVVPPPLVLSWMGGAPVTPTAP